MTTAERVIRQQLPATLTMALPIIVGQLGQMAMILIDTYMVGKLGPQALGGVGLGAALFYAVSMFGAGTLFGLDYLVSHAFGKKDLDECHHWLWQAVYLSILLSLPLLALLEWLATHLAVFNFPSDIAVPASQFLATLSLSLPSFLIFIAFRQYLQATDSVRPGTIVTSIAILSNIVLNTVFIFGHLGCPALGVAGAGLATTVTRTLMAVSLVWYTFHRDDKLGWGLRRSPRRWHRGGLSTLFRMGAPAGLQLTFETAVFSLATTLISHLGAIPAASHTIVINITSFTYMVPIGLAGATAVLVGQQVGAGDPRGARETGWLSLGLAAAVMAVSGLILVAGGRHIVGLFTTDAAVIVLGARLLLLVAFYQVADGLQAVGGGALRGVGDTRSPMVANLLGYWGVGLPLGYWLCFPQGMGVMGFWIGLTVGLLVVAAITLSQWRRRTGNL